MRRYNISVGKFRGSHYIFDTEMEAAQFLQKDTIVTETHLFVLYNSFFVARVIKNNEGAPETFRHWANLQNRKGDWVRTDDGRIAQILNWYIMPSRQRKTDSPEPLPLDTIYIRFPFMSASVYIKKDGTLRYNYVHADMHVRDYTNIKKGSITNKNAVTKKNKRLFAYYLVVSGNPIKAYHLTFPGHYHNKLIAKHIPRKATELVRDKQVLAEILEYMTIEEFRKKYQDAADKAGLDIDFLFTQIKRGAEQAAGGSEDHQNMLKMIAEVIEKVNDVQILTQDNNPAKIDKMASSPILPPPKEEIKGEIELRNPELLG